MSEGKKPFVAATPELVLQLLALWWHFACFLLTRDDGSLNPYEGQRKENTFIDPVLMVKCT